MSDDIVTRLRNSGDHESPMGKGLTFKVRFPIMLEAADEIERLRARVDHWKLMYETALKLYYNEHGRLPNE